MPQTVKRIKFKKAKNLNEAELYAQNVLGIKNYEVNNLSMANWINKGLQIVYNRFNGLNNLETITIASKKSKSMIPARYYPILKKLEFNETAMDKNLSQLITNLTFNGEIMPVLSTKLNKIYQNYFKLIQNKNIPLQAKNHLYDLITYHYNSNIFPLYSTNKLEKNILKYQTILTELAKTKNIKLPQNNYDSMAKWTPEEKAWVLADIISTLNKLGYKPQKQPKAIKQNYFYYIFHEFGHHLHNQEIGTSKFLTLFDSKLSTKDKRYITKNVSRYAGTSPIEFVAEVIAQKLSGTSHPQKILKIYEKFNGPKLSF